MTTTSEQFEIPQTIEKITAHYRAVVSSKADIIDPVFYNAVKIVKLSMEVAADPTNADKHRKLHAFIRRKNEDNEFTQAYAIECEEYHYQMGNWGKMWVKDGKTHRTTKDKNGLTLPARIDDDGEKLWMYEGNCHREDRDADGYLLPAKMMIGLLVWMQHGKVHRAELDANGKALPAKIFTNGLSNEYYYDGEKLTQEKLTKKILNKREKKFTNAKKVEITLSDGSSIVLSSSISSVHVLL